MATDSLLELIPLNEWKLLHFAPLCLDELTCFTSTEWNVNHNRMDDGPGIFWSRYNAINFLKID